MISTGRTDASVIAQRFRSGADWFVSLNQPDVYTYLVGAASERSLDIMQSLVGFLPESVSVSISSLRERKSWWDNACPRSEVRDVLARLKVLLAGYGGVEFAVYTSSDQLTLTPELELVIYSRTAAWPARLLRAGLEERAAPPTAVWKPSRVELPPAPELLDSIAGAVRRLNLAPGEFDVEPSR